MDTSRVFLSSDRPEATQKIACSLKEQFPQVNLWLLYGDLASGKTTFVKGLSKDAKSPSFTLINEHQDLIHCDLYRLDSLEETLQSQLEENLWSGLHMVIEWPELFEEYVKVPHLKIRFQHEGGDKRLICVEDYSSSGLTA